MELVSVIIPTYNRCEKLWYSIESVLNQTYKEIELIVVDDGSTDDTEKMVCNIKDERVRYIKLSENKGVSFARNEGAYYAKGEIIAFHDSDDLWREDKLQKQMSYLESNPAYAMVYTPYILHSADGQIRMPNIMWEGLEGDIFPWLLLRNSIGAPTMLLRKGCFLEVGGFNTALKSLEDWEFVLRFAEQYRIGFVDEVLVDAYASGSGVSSRIGAGFETRCYIVSYYKNYLIQYELFDIVVRNLFEQAERYGVLKEVKVMLETLLK